MQGNVEASSKMSMRLFLKSEWASWRMWYKMQPLDYIRLVNNELRDSTAVTAGLVCV